MGCTMLSIVWLWLAAAVPCWATLSASDDLDPRSKALDLNGSSQPMPPIDLLPSSGAHASTVPTTNLLDDAETIRSFGKNAVPASYPYERCFGACAD